MRLLRDLAGLSRRGWQAASLIAVAAVGSVCLLFALLPALHPRQPLTAVGVWQQVRPSGEVRLDLATLSDGSARAALLHAVSTATDTLQQNNSSGQAARQDIAEGGTAATRLTTGTASAAPPADDTEPAAVDPAAAPGAAAASSPQTAQHEVVLEGNSSKAFIEERATARHDPGARHSKGAAEPPGRATLAICLVTRIDADDPQWVDGEAEDLHEWIEHHEALGVGRIYVFDHGSEVPLRGTLRRHIASQLVRYEYSTMGFRNSTGGEVHPQLAIYQQCLKRFGHRHRFMAFIDSDEFFSMPKRWRGAPTTLPELLNAYAFVRSFGGLVVPWIMFGPSGHETRPSGGVLANYWTCLPRNQGHSRHVKTIVNTRHALQMISPHHWTYEAPFFAVDEDLERADGPIMPEGRGSVNRIALHHYVTKSLEDFQAKSKRGDGMGSRKQMGFYEQIKELATEDCTDAMARILRHRRGGEPVA